MHNRIRDGNSQRGQENSKTKISEQLATEIKISWKPLSSPDYVSISERANQFGVKKSTIISIDYGNAWRHISGPRDDLISEKMTQMKDARRIMRKNTRTNGLCQDEYDFLSNKISRKIEPEHLSKNSLILTPCSVWIGAQDREGYGIITHKYCHFRTHIIVYEQSLGKVAKGYIVRHLCGIKKCCAIDHLSIGTHSDNMIDAIIHKDIAYKITQDDVINIRSCVAQNDTNSVLDASNKYNLSTKHIIAVLQGKYWNWIQNQNS